MGKLDQEIALQPTSAKLLAEQGKFVLIKGTDLTVTFDSYQDALTAGYQRFKLDSFLVKQVDATEPKTFSRDLIASSLLQISSNASKES